MLEHRRGLEPKTEREDALASGTHTQSNSTVSARTAAPSREGAIL
jgi:hypothetical protein